MKINAIDESGKLKEYDVILTYHSDNYNKDYIVYTDNIYNSNDELQIYINEYNKYKKGGVYHERKIIYIAFARCPRLPSHEKTSSVDGRSQRTIR